MSVENFLTILTWCFSSSFPTGSGLLVCAEGREKEKGGFTDRKEGETSQEKALAQQQPGGNGAGFSEGRECCSGVVQE